MVERKQEVPLSHLGAMAKQCVEDSERWFGDSAVVYNVEHHALAMSAEVGAFCNVVKKIQRGDLDPKDARVRMLMATKLTDSFVYMLVIAGLLNFDLEKTYMMVRANNERRFAEERKQKGNGALKK